jgi:hypothetical protein
MPGPTSILTLAETRTHLNFPAADTSHDTELQGFIDDASPVIEDVVGPVDEWYDGGAPWIILRRRPVVSVTTVTEYRGPLGYVLTQVATPDLGTTYSYSFEPTGRLIRRSAGGGSAPFPSGAGAVHVVYVAGRASVPPNVRLAALELVRHLYQMTQQGGRPAFGTGGGGGMEEMIGATPSGFAIPTRVLELLGTNRRYPSLA